MDKDRMLIGLLISTFVLLVGFILLIPNTAKSQQEPAIAHRYRLAVGQSELGHTLYRIDSFTGKTWEYTEVKNEQGKYQAKFVELHEN